jgi:hypothetical protein
MNVLRNLFIYRRAPGISHLLFADDSLLCFEGSVEQATIVKRVLDDYEKGTSQLVSTGKCSILFLYGSKCYVGVQHEIKDILRYEIEAFEEKYLGLPRWHEGGQVQACEGKFLRRANDWSEKYISGGAKGMLIKSSLQSLTTYAMGFFKFPVGLI